MKPLSGKVIGIDLGGTKLAGILLSIQGDVLVRERCPVPDDLDQEGLIKLLASFVRQLARVGGEPAAVGIGVPGPLQEGGRVLPEVPNFPHVGRMLLKDPLEEALGMAVTLENDANCFALGESLYGWGRGHPCVVGITMGTGLGVGIVIENRIHRGSHWEAGEIWDLPLGDGTIVEDGLSGRYVADEAGTASAQEAAERARHGEARALAAWQAFGLNLNWLMGVIGRLLDPDLFVLGGSLSRAYDLFSDELAGVVPRWPVRVSSDSEEMAMRGVAAVAGRPGLR